MQGEPQALEAEAKKSCHSQTPINKCSIFDHPSNFKGLQPIPHAISPQMAPHHAPPRSHIPSPNQKAKAESNKNRDHTRIPRAAHETTPQCPTHPPQRPPQTNTYIDEPSETSPKPSTKTVQVHPITRTTSIQANIMFLQGFTETMNRWSASNILGNTVPERSSSIKN